MAEGNCTFVDRHDEDVTGIGSFIVVSVSIGVLLQVLKKNAEWLNIPYTMLLFISGMLLAALDHGVGKIGILSSSIETWKELDAEVLAFMFLPPLLFASAFVVQYHIFRRLAGQAILLATVGVVVSAVLIAVLAIYGFDYQYGWIEGLMFGAAFSATDPVSVVALLHELGAPEPLSVLIEGESLLNDGVGFALFTVFFEQLSGRANYNAGGIVGRVMIASTGGVLVGVFMGFVSLKMLELVWNDHILAVSISIVSVWGVFYLAEAVKVSGVVAVVCLGLVHAAYSDGYIQVEVLVSLKRFWQKIEFIANTLVFAFSGVVVMSVFIDAETVMTGTDVWYNLVLFVCINVFRFVMCGALLPALSGLGYGMDRKRFMVLGYAGLRGAVGLISALIVFDNNSCIATDLKNQLMFHMAGIVLLTLAINGTTTKCLVSKLGLDKQSKAEMMLFNQATMHLHDHIDFVVESLQRHPHYKSADWDEVWKHVPILSNEVYQERKKMGLIGHDSFSITRTLERITKSRFVDDESEPEEGEKLANLRYRFLELVKASYRSQFHDGANKSWPQMQVLIEAASRCQDKPHKPINEWEASIEAYVRLPHWLVPDCFHPQAKHIANSYDVACTFVRAHKAVVSQFRHFDQEGTEEAMEAILEENRIMLSEATEYTARIEEEYPDIAQAVKTNIATQRLLKEFHSYSKKMFRRAELDEKDLHTIEKELEESRRHLFTRVAKPKPKTKEQVIKNSSVMLEVEHEIVDMLIALSTVVELRSNEIIINKGEISHDLFIVGRGKVFLENFDGAESLHLEKGPGDIIGVVGFSTDHPQNFTTRCTSHVELYCIKGHLVQEAMAQSTSLATNIMREAGLIILEAAFPQFQYASFNLLKSVLPHVRIVRGSGALGHGSLSRRPSIVRSKTPIFFHGGIVIGLTPEIRTLTGDKEIPMRQVYKPECALILNKDASLMHVNAEAVANLERYVAFEQLQQTRSQPSSSVIRKPNHSVLSRRWIHSHFERSKNKDHRVSIGSSVSTSSSAEEKKKTQAMFTSKKSLVARTHDVSSDDNISDSESESDEDLNHFEKML